MPVGAIIGAGALTAGATVAAGSSNSKAINNATTAQTQGNAQSLALQQDIYGQNKAALAPWQSSGLAANQQINALLGLSPVGNDNAVGALSGYGDTGAQAGTGALSATNAYEAFKRSTGYQNRLDEGMNALNSGWAARGTLQSGAAIKSAMEYGQNLASAEFGNYLNNLQTQQNMGLSAASAQAGVGQNFAGNVTALNTANSNALASGAIAKANNTTGMIGGLTNALNSSVGAVAYPSLWGGGGALSSYSTPAYAGLKA